MTTGLGRFRLPPFVGSRLRGGIPALVLFAVLAILILLPGAFLLLAAFSTDVPRPGNITWNLTLQNLEILTRPSVLGASLNSLTIAAGATAIALTIGGFLAFVSARTDIPGRQFIYFVGLVPMFLPSYVGALAWSMLGSPTSGLLNVAARDLGLPLQLNVYGVGGMIFVAGIFYAPYGFLLIHSVMSLMNPDFEEAATVHGGATRRVLRAVTFPLALPAILGAATLIFVLVFENFPVAQVLASPAGVDTLPTYLYRMMNGFPSRGNEAAALAIALVAFVALLTWLQRKVLERRSYAMVTGKGIRPRIIQLGPFRWIAFAAALAYFMCAVVLPLGALLLTAVRASPYMYSFSALMQPGAIDLGAFADAVSGGFWQVLSNSVGVSVVAAVAGTVLAFLVAYVAYRTSSKAGPLLEGVSMVPLAIPAIVLGMGLLWTWLVMPLPVYGTLAVLIIAFVAVQMPQGFRSVAASILSTDRDLEDSAVMLGATRTRAVLWVTVPLLRVALSSTFLLLLMLSMRELTVPLFLYTSETKLLSITIFESFEYGGALQEASAVSLIYCALMVLLSYLPRRIGRGREIS